MTTKLENLVAEMQRMLGVYSGSSPRMARINSKRIGVLHHLIEFAGSKPSPIKYEPPVAVGKSFDELEKEREAGETEKKRPVKKAKKEEKQEEKKEEPEQEEKEN